MNGTTLITGGAGAVGQYAVQFAKLGGARVLTTVSTDNKAELARKCAADEVIRYKDENVSERVRELTDGKGVDRIVEVDFGGNLATSIDVLKPNGVIAAYASDAVKEPVGQHVLFIIMATIWGLTWIAIKTGVDAVLPFFFASVRLLIAGSVLLLLARKSGVATSIDGFLGPILLAGVLVNTVTYGLIFWGMQYVPSGLSSVVNLALIPVGLFTIGLAAKEETYSGRKAAAIALGVSGLTVLFLTSFCFLHDMMHRMRNLPRILP